MSIAEKFAAFKDAYNDAIEDINRHLSDTTKPEMHTLTHWIMNTDENPYGFLHNNGGLLYTAESCAGLLNMIHHALYDDGDVTFITVDGEPRIVFFYYEEEYRHMALNDVEREYEQNGLSRPEIKKLKDVYEFIGAFDIHNKDRCHLFFKNDVWSEGLEAAIEKNKDSKYFDPAWIPKTNIELEPQDSI